jgi:hypothetical protein
MASKATRSRDGELRLGLHVEHRVTLAEIAKPEASRLATRP